MKKFLIAAVLVGATFGGAGAATYDPTTNFAVGWASDTNPNGVWSYGYSSSFSGAITLYTGLAGPGPDSPTEIFWVSPAYNCCFASPAVGFNDGPAFNDGNVALAAHQMDLVSSVYQNLVTDLVFTAPTTGTYDLTSAFTGSQYGIGVYVALLDNGATIFSSNVSAFGQVVPYDTTLSLTAGDTVVFAVQQGGGLQNTGLDVSLTTGGTVPEPSTWAMMLVGFAGLGFAKYRKATDARAALSKRR